MSKQNFSCFSLSPMLHATSDTWPQSRRPPHLAHSLAREGLCLKFVVARLQECYAWAAASTNFCSGCGGSGGCQLRESREERCHRHAAGAGRCHVPSCTARRLLQVPAAQCSLQLYLQRARRGGWVTWGLLGWPEAICCLQYMLSRCLGSCCWILETRNVGEHEASQDSREKGICLLLGWTPRNSGRNVMNGEHIYRERT